MNLRNEFDVAVPVDRVWETLLDVERVARFLPGATVEPGEEEGTFNGSMKVKLGPMTVNYAGTAKLSDVDESQHSAAIQVQAKERKGQGTAAAVIHNRLVPEDGSTRVIVETDLQITGRQAQFGRGIMDDVASRMFDDFARRFEAYLLEGDGAAAADDAARGPATDGQPARADEEEALDLGSVITSTDAMRYGALAATALLVLALVGAIARMRRSRDLEVKFDRSW